jgi:hypothetical protein
MHGTMTSGRVGNASTLRFATPAKYKLRLMIKQNGEKNACVHFLHLIDICNHMWREIRDTSYSPSPIVCEYYHLTLPS